MELILKRKRGAGRAVCAVCALLLAGCCAVLLSASPTPAADSPVIAARDGYALLRGSPRFDVAHSTVTVSRRQLLQGTLMLVSAVHPLPADFPAPDTRAVRMLVGSYLPAKEDTALCQDAIYALCSLESRHPMTGFLVYENGAVSASQQEKLRLDAFDRFRLVYPLQEALDRSRLAVPGGGESEHQLGYAVDLTLSGPLTMAGTDPLLRSESGRWLSENLWQYGFIRRYAPGTNEEGACEHIHLRYVGAWHAIAMHVLDLSLEDYLALLRKEGSLTLTDDEGKTTVWIQCSPWNGGDWQLALSEGYSSSFSSDNTGWAVAAIWSGGP